MTTTQPTTRKDEKMNHEEKKRLLAELRKAIKDGDRTKADRLRAVLTKDFEAYK